MVQLVSFPASFITHFYKTAEIIKVHSAGGTHHLLFMNVLIPS